MKNSALTTRSAATSRRGKVKLPPSVTGMRWSDPATWGGTLPNAGQPVTIGAGTTVILDVPNALASFVDVQGTLKADPYVDVGLTTGHINVGSSGYFEIGTPLAPYTKKATITLNGSEVGRVARFITDQTGTSGTGNGRLARLFASSGAVAETLTISFTSSTTFTVSGSVSGSLGSGTVGALFNNRVRFIATQGTVNWAAGNTITLVTEQVGFQNNGVGRSLQVMGRLSLIGVAPAIKRTRLNASAAAAATSLALANAVSWKASDEVVIGPTEWRIAENTSLSHATTLTADALGTTIGLASGLPAARYGVLQYVTDAGLSLTPGTLTKPAAWLQDTWDATPKVLDERAVVMHMTRNIVIQGANDSAWSTNGFGGHCMFMTRVANAIRIDGVEFKRMGQAGALGRYPLHWHAVSYNMPDGFTLPSDGTFLGDAVGHYVKNSSINRSTNRAIALHGTHGVTVDSNNIFDIKTHAIFLEDGAEQDNVITNNVVMNVMYAPVGANALTIREQGFNREVTCLWISNPKNTVTGNWVGDCSAVGWWLATYVRCFGLMGEVTLTPLNTRHGNLDGNIAFCNTSTGFNNSDRQHDNRGNSYFIAQWAPTDNDMPSGNQVIGVLISHCQNWKNIGGGYNNRVSFPLYRSWVSADNGGLDFVGATNPVLASFGERLLDVGLSLNNATPYSAINSSPRSAWATYHGTLQFRDSIAVNFPYVNAESDPYLDENGGGIFALTDLYIGAVDVSFYETFRILNINSATTPYRAKSKNSLGNYVRGTFNPTFSDVIIDFNSVHGGPVGKVYWVRTDPFLTLGLTDAVAAFNPADNNGSWTATKYIGFDGLIPDWLGLLGKNEYETIGVYFIDRYDSSGSTVIASKTWDPKPNFATRPIDDKYYGTFRHFAAQNNGIYRLYWPTPYDIAPYGPPLVYTRLRLNQLSQLTDYLTLGLPWGGSTAATVKIDGAGFVRNYTLAANFAEVRDDATGTKYWIDTAAKTIWMKLRGGFPTYGADGPSPGSTITVAA